MRGYMSVYASGEGVRCVREEQFIRGAPELEPPHRVILRLAARLTADGQTLEETYLNAANPKDRWAKRYFPNVDDEFHFKVVWVARLLRRDLGSPSHPAFVTLPASVSVHRAAAWRLGGNAVGYVSLRALRGARRPRVSVILGAMGPHPPTDFVAVHVPKAPRPVSQAEEKVELLRRTVVALVAGGAADAVDQSRNRPTEK
jgi:hypothetical protein